MTASLKEDKHETSVVPNVAHSSKLNAFEDDSRRLLRNRMAAFTCEPLSTILIREEIAYATHTRTGEPKSSPFEPQIPRL